MTVCNHISGPQLQLCPNPQEQDTASDIRVPDWGTSDVNYREGLTLELKNFGSPIKLAESPGTLETTSSSFVTVMKCFIRLLCFHDCLYELCCQVGIK